MKDEGVRKGENKAKFSHLGNEQDEKESVTVSPLYSK